MPEWLNILVPGIVSLVTALIVTQAQRRVTETEATKNISEASVELVKRLEVEVQRLGDKVERFKVMSVRQNARIFALEEQIITLRTLLNSVWEIEVAQAAELGQTLPIGLVTAVESALRETCPNEESETGR